MPTGQSIETAAPKVSHAFVRRADLDEADLQLPFHQDTKILGVPLINLWIPLSACGRLTPGLEIVTRHLDGLIATVPMGTAGTLYAEHGIEIDPATILGAFGDALWAPAFEVGDVLIFHSNAIHRSDANRSDNRRWTLLVCYNRVDNDTVTRDDDRYYVPLDKVDDGAVLRAGLAFSKSDQEHFASKPYVPKLPTAAE